MTSRTVKSHAGDEIEIIADNDWIMSVGGTDRKTIRAWQGLKPAVIRELWLHGKSEDRQTGQAARKLYERVIQANPDVELGNLTALTPVMRDPANAPAFERITNGKRTQSIKLVAMPELWYAKLLDDLTIEFPAIPVNSTPVEFPNPQTEPIEPEPVSEPEAVSASEPVSDSMPLDVEIASQVAMSLLTTVVEIISAGGSNGLKDSRIEQLSTDLRTVSNHLASRLEENERLRKQVRAAGDEIIALKTERDGLRMRLRKTESNLTAALKGETLTAVNSEITKRIDQFMRATPQTKGDD